MTTISNAALDAYLIPGAAALIRIFLTEKDVTLCYDLLPDESVDLGLKLIIMGREGAAQRDQKNISSSI